MDPALATLAGAAGAALVQSVTKDTWEATKARVAKIFSRHGKDDEPDLGQLLDVTEHRLQSLSGPLDPVMDEERQRWAALLAAFLSQHREAASELQDFVREVRQLAARDSFTVVQQIFAGRDSYTAGRDQRVFSRADDARSAPPHPDENESAISGTGSAEKAIPPTDDGPTPRVDDDDGR
jgi:hypothetical protein